MWSYLSLSLFQSSKGFQTIRYWTFKLSCKCLFMNINALPLSLAVAFPSSSKGYFDELIRITIQVIRITNEEEVKLRATDSNHPYSDSNPSWRKVKRLKHRLESPIQWFESLMKNKIRQFESLSYEFESLNKWSKRLKVGQSDSNHWVTDSNHSMAQNSNIVKVIWITQIAIRITHSAEALIARPALYNNSIFHLNLSHNG